jgi:hypothetical protein
VALAYRELHVGITPTCVTPRIIRWCMTYQTVSLSSSFHLPFIHSSSQPSHKMSYNILGSGYRPNITLFSFDSTSAKIHKVSDTKAPENASWLEPGKNGVIYSTSEVPKGEVYSLKLQGEDLETTGKRSTKGEEPAHGT